MTVPSEPMAVPELVDLIAAGRPVAAVWENELGGITYAIGDAEFVKVYPDDAAHLLAAEVPRLRWAELAIATVSLDWNFPTEGPGGFQDVLLDAYGVAADVEHIPVLHTRVGRFRRRSRPAGGLDSPRATTPQ